MGNWNPSTWVSKPARQQPTYPDQGALTSAVNRLATLPPLVTSWEVERLRSQLAEAAEGKRFLLQGGACAERFDQCTADVITNKLKILLQMSLVLTFGLKRRIIRVGRFAGQYAKPRSSDAEERDGVTLPCYRGEIINGPAFTEADRIPDPTTAGDFCRRFSSEQVEILQDIINNVRLKVWRQQVENRIEKGATFSMI